MPNWKYIFALYLGLCLLLDVALPSRLNVSYLNYLFPIVLILLVSEYRHNTAFKNSLLMVGGFCVYQLIVNTIVQPLRFSEILWSFQFLKIFTLFWCAHFMMKNNKHLFRILIDTAFIILVLINVFQLIEITAVLEIYAPSTNYFYESTSSVLDARLYGSFLNPNNNALSLLLFLVYYIYNNRHLKWSLVVIAALLIFMTQSRTALLLMVLVFGIFALFSSNINRKKLAIFGVFGVAAIAAVLAVFKFDYILMLVDGRIFTSSSFLTRTEAISAVLDINSSDWIIGQGKVGDIPSFIGYSIDNQYFYTYLEYGVVGVIMLISLIAYLIKLSFRPLRLMTITLMLCLIFAGFSNLSFSNGELISLYSALLASSFLLITNNSNTKQTI